MRVEATSLRMGTPPRWALLLLVILSVTSVGCGGGGGSSPTESKPREVFVLVGVVWSQGCDCLEEVEVLLDGKVLGRSREDSPGQIVWGTAEFSALPEAIRGRHVLGVRITKLRTSSAFLVASGGGSVMDVQTGATVANLAPLAARQGRMKEGDEFRWTIDY
jgi:hypothetical protein